MRPEYDSTLLDRQGVVRYTGNELPADYARRLDTLLAEKVMTRR